MGTSDYGEINDQENGKEPSPADLLHVDDVPVQIKHLGRDLGHQAVRIKPLAERLMIFPFSPMVYSLKEEGFLS